MSSDNRAAGQSAAEQSLTPIEMQQTIQVLQTRLAELRAENAALRQASAEGTRPGTQIDGQDGLASTSPPLSKAEGRQSHHLLHERIKELGCLYDVTALLNRTDLTQEQLAHAIVDRIAAAYQYPAVSCARLTLDDQTYATENFADTPWQQTSTSLAGADRVGLAHGSAFKNIRPASTMLVVPALIRPEWKVEIEAEAIIEKRP